MYFLMFGPYYHALVTRKSDMREFNSDMASYTRKFRTFEDLPQWVQERVAVLDAVPIYELIPKVGSRRHVTKHRHIYYMFSKTNEDPPVCIE